MYKQYTTDTLSSQSESTQDLKANTLKSTRYLKLPLKTKEDA